MRKWSKDDGDGDDGLDSDYEELHVNYIRTNKPRLCLIEYLKIKLILVYTLRRKFAYSPRAMILFLLKKHSGQMVTVGKRRDRL